MLAIDSPKPGNMGSAGSEQGRFALAARMMPAAPPLMGAAAVTASVRSQTLAPQRDFAKPDAAPRPGAAADRATGPTARAPDVRSAEVGGLTRTNATTEVSEAAAAAETEAAKTLDLAELARLPTPLKGLGIPPLNTRQVGDFDKLDDLPPPVGLDISEQLAVLDPPEQGSFDLRR